LFFLLLLLLLFFFIFIFFEFFAKAIAYCGRYINDDIKSEIINRGSDVAYKSEVKTYIKASCCSLADELNEEASQ